MNKKFLSLVLALVMVLGTFTSVFAAGTAEKKEEVKVPKLTTSNAKIEWLKDNDIIEGRKVNEDPKDNDLALDKTIQRAEVTKLLVHAVGKADLADKLQGTMMLFTDVKTDYWANGFITVAATSASEANGLPFIQGYPTGEFKAVQPVTYAELAKMLVVLVDEDLTTEKVEAANADWPTAWMTMAVNEGIFEGLKDIKANDKVIRSAGFEMMFNAFYAMEDLSNQEATQTIGIISEQSKDKKLVLNQGDYKKEFKVDEDTVFVKHAKDNSTAEKWLSDEGIADEYYVGSLVRVLADKEGVITHILQLGNPKDLALDKEIWEGVADEVIDTKDLTNDPKSVKIEKETIKFDDVNVITNDDTRFFVADEPEDCLTEVKDLDAVKDLLDDDTAAEKVYAGYDVLKTSDKNYATVVVFNDVDEDENNEVVRVAEDSDSLYNINVQMPGYKATKVIELSNRDNDKIFPLNISYEKYDVLKTEVEDGKYVEGINTADVIIDHSEAPVLEVTDIDYKDVNGSDEIGAERIETIELSDGDFEATFDVLSNADIFFGNELKEGKFVQVHFTDDDYTAVDVISVVDDTETDGNLPEKVRTSMKEETGKFVGISKVGENLIAEFLVDGVSTNYVVAGAEEKDVVDSDDNELVNGTEYTFLVDENKYDNKDYAYKFVKSTAQSAPEDAKKDLTIEFEHLYIMSTLVLDGNAQKVISLADAKDESELSMIDFDKIQFADKKLTVNDGAISTKNWDTLKETGDVTAPFRITVLKGEDKSEDKVAKIAFYRDGSVAIEEF